MSSLKLSLRILLNRDKLNANLHEKINLTEIKVKI